VTKAADVSLRDRAILVTRPEERGQELARLLAERGARVDQRPTIALGPPADPAPAAAVLARLDEFDWILFSSSNGVRFFFERLEAAHPPARSPRARIAAIGPATAHALEARGLDPEVVPAESHGDGFADALSRRVRRGERALLVRPEQSRPALGRRLEELGLRVEAVPFYRNLPAPGLAAIAEDVLAGRYDAIVFTAPSTLRRLLEGAGERGRNLRASLAAASLVAIGPVTAAALEAEGFEVAAVAADPSDRGLLEALGRALAR
jgi:uroporphyrinogen-III synthase